MDAHCRAASRGTWFHPAVRPVAMSRSDLRYTACNTRSYPISMTRGKAISLPRRPTAHTVTTRSATKMSPIADQNQTSSKPSAASERDQHQQQVGVQRDRPVADADLLQPVAQRRAGQSIGPDVFQRAALPAHPLSPQRPPRGHHLSDDVALHRRDRLRAERSSRPTSSRCPRSSPACRRPDPNRPGSGSRASRPPPSGRTSERAMRCR